jgi:hypothetical protein
MAKKLSMFLLDREDHSQPHLHTATMVGYRGQLLIAVLAPVLATLRRILGTVQQPYSSPPPPPSENYIFSSRYSFCLYC